MDQPKFKVGSIVIIIRDTIGKLKKYSTKFTVVKKGISGRVIKVDKYQPSMYYPPRNIYLVEVRKNVRYYIKSNDLAGLLYRTKK